MLLIIFLILGLSLPNLNLKVGGLLQDKLMIFWRETIFREVYKFVHELSIQAKPKIARAFNISSQNKLELILLEPRFNHVELE